MSYQAQEQSIEVGSPIELYEISYDSVTYRYTSGDAEYTDDATTRTYAPLLISRSDIEYTTDLAKGSLELQVQYDAVFLDMFRTSVPSGVVSITLKRVHRTDLSSQIIVVWKGRIINVSWANNTATLACEPIRASVQRYGLRRLFQYQCPHVLYGATCGVSRALYEVTGIVESITGSTIHVTGLSSFTTDYFAGGYAQYVSSTMITNERRMITNSVGGSNEITLVSPPVNLNVGDTVRVYPGCDHIIDTCGTKFNNVVNFGGFPYTPTKNPFSGEVIY
jgi:uncharacterized phage protein (TIGR02218 family)